jgi:Insertion element 4 transposase N-terminal/Transposase DDE domain
MRVDAGVSGSGRRFTEGISIGVLTRLFDRDLVDEVLARSGAVQARSRLLPARVVVYYVLALCLFFEDSYEEVMRKLVNGLRFLGSWTDEWRMPTPSAISQGRARLGAAPLEELFFQVARPMAGRGHVGAWFRDWRVMAMDGVVLDVADTPANLDAFGAYSGGTSRKSPFPQVRLVGLGECATHAIVAAAFDSWRVYERELAERLAGDVESDMLILADRGFYSYNLWQKFIRTGAVLVWRIRDTIDLPVLEWLPDGSYRSELVPSKMKAQFKVGKLKAIPDEVRIPVRVVEYMVTNRGDSTETIRLVTSILDHTAAATAELASLYQQRWEFELTLDEIETHQMSHHRVLRSRTPELVRQEIWALLLTHYAVRDFMRQAADDIGEDDDRISFMRSIRVIRRQVLNQAGFSPSAPHQSDTRNHR